MEEFFTFLDKHVTGVLLLILMLIAVNLSVNWYAKLFNWGKYKSQNVGNGPVQMNQENVGYVVAKFFANIIDDFRHFLALFLVIIFFSLLIYSMYISSDTALHKEQFNQMKEMLQLVLASLGGLLGSIIGYYFGESAASNKQIVQNQNNLPSSPQPRLEPDIEPVQAPQNLPE
jgi:ABC-type multidrug transport system permease subunit